jgi:hypothetical protein
MTIRKYRSVGEMPALPATGPVGAEGLRQACELSDLAYRLRPWFLPPGVRRFRSQSDADRNRQAWEAAQVRRADSASAARPHPGRA